MGLAICMLSLIAVTIGFMADAAMGFRMKWETVDKWQAICGIMVAVGIIVAVIEQLI